jgi:hypothetical protein
MKKDKINQILMLLSLILFAGCGNQSEHIDNDNSPLAANPVKSNDGKKSVYSKKSVDSLIQAGVISQDSLADAPPTQAEERKALENKYNQIKIIDTIFSSKDDTLHFYSKYYCLKNINLIEPKLYDLNSKSPKAFITHPFVVDIWLTNKRDTVLKKQFKASGFNPFFQDNFGGALKKYGTIIDLNLSKRNKEKSRIILACSIAIPATDIGTGLYLLINNRGGYKITDKLP